MKEEKKDLSKDPLVQIWVYTSDRTKINQKRAKKNQSQAQYINEKLQ